MESAQKYFDLKTVAQIFGVSLPTVYSWMKFEDNPLPSFKVGNKRFVNANELEQWLELRREDSYSGRTGIES